MFDKASLWGLLLLCALSNSALSDAGWTAKGEILALSATSFSKIVIRGNFPENISGCRDKERFYFDFGRPGTRFIYDLLLTAVASDKRIKLRVTGNCELKGMSEISEASILAN